MWNLRAGGRDTALGLFGDDSMVVDELLKQSKYRVEVLTFSKSQENKFKLYRYDPDPSTPQSVFRKDLLGEFDDVNEFIAMARLIVASETN